jgi:type 1 glutamine amidotransferase
MFKKTVAGIFALISVFVAEAQLEKFEVNEEWIMKIEKMAPSEPKVKPGKKYKVLVFDRFTGFNHWATPHTTEVIKILGDKSGAFETVVSKDPFSFEAENLKKYDAVVLNNNCSVGPRRDQFLDMLDEDADLSEEQKKKKAAELENNLIGFVKNGGGLMVIHGAIVMQNNSMAFSEMVGGSFDFHPPQQDIVLELADPEHPLVAAFEGKPFVHVDEPYLFKNAYAQKNFRPLLYMNTSTLTGNKEPFDEIIKYVSWIKKHGKGRVFYISPSHNAQSFEDERMLKFFLDGAQYVLGDLKCDDSPIGR